MKGFLERFISYFKVRYAILLIPLCGFAVYDSVFQAFSSILGILHDTYPDIPVTVIQMVITVPPMMSIPGTLLTGFLASYVHKKRIAEFALAVIFIGGMIPIVVPEPTIEALFICAGCIGLGQGLLHPLANAIICQRWGDDLERSRVLGFKQAFNYIGEVIVTMIVGILALYSWSNAFLVYLGVIPIFIMTVIFVPKMDLDVKLVDKGSHPFEGIKDLFQPKTIYLFALFFFAAMCLYGYYTNIALLVQEREFGNTVDVSGITSTISIISMVIGIAYGAIAKRLGRFTLTTGFVSLACGMMVMAASNSLIMLGVGALLIGFGVGIQQISTIYYISKDAPKRLVTMAVSLILCFVALGASVAPIVQHFIKTVIVGVETPGVSFMISGVGYFILAIIEGIVAKIGRNKAMVSDEDVNMKDLDVLD